MKRIYLDNAALKPPNRETVEYVGEILSNQSYNPNALYEDGRLARNIITKTKEIIAQNINCSPDELTFCSCGSEANALAVLGYLRANDEKNFVTSVIEHSSISEIPCSRKIVTVDEQGFFRFDDIEKIHDSFVSLQMANSEFGTIQNMKEIIGVLHHNHCVVHTDAVAAFGQVPIDVRDLNVDMLTATGQKIGGMLGASFLFKKEELQIEPFIYGHMYPRSGTPNVPAIASFGKAMQTHDFCKVSSNNRDYVYKYVTKKIPNVSLVGADIGSRRLPNNLCLRFDDVQGEALATMLDLYGVQVSTGSACNNFQKTSTVFPKLGMTEKDAQSIIRLSFSGQETRKELEYVNFTLKHCVQKLRLFH